MPADASIRDSLLQQIPPLLLDWFQAAARDLPWRKTRDPYAIWISEIMLQQTQVKTVIPYWERWMRELPHLQSLAQARPERILKLWEGLGYYSRSRNLQKAAQMIVAKWGGRFPSTLEELLELPGIGPYTAGAISSIAFNQPSPILDGNVIRVLSRVFALSGNPRQPKEVKRWWTLARELVENANQLPGESEACSRLNQSLMELGALVCLPRQPLCQGCPLSAHCLAFRRNAVDKFPRLPIRAAPLRKRVMALVCQEGDRFLVRQRPPDAINGSFYEFPSWELLREDRSELNAISRRHFRSRPDWRPLCQIKHSITNSRITLQAFHGQVRGPVRQLPGEWKTQRQLASLPFTSAHRKIIRQLTRI